MAKFRKKPVEIEAVKFEDTTESMIAITELAPNEVLTISYKTRPITLKIPTLEGDMTATEGDYIIKGVEGEIYPCKPDIFHKTYEEVK